VRKKLIVFGLLGVGVAAVYGLLMEKAGRVECPCEPTCWCKRPGLSFFRWVTPVRWHRVA
jgi:hypothetical protein